MKRTFVWLLVGALGCSDGDIGTTGPGGGGGGGDDDDDDFSGLCTDSDEDGFGVGCAAGVDCDDTDPNLSSDCDFRAFGDPWSPDNGDGVVIDENGALTLGETSFEDDTVWIANADENTVSKLDALTGRELARYPSAIAGGNSARPWTEWCNFSSSGNCPSRTSIDFRRDCWVANRAFGNQGSVTKIANRIEDCIDRNANGVIDTSTDANGDGRIDNPGEMVGDDECVLFTVDVGGFNGVPRALAIAPDTRFISAGGNAWVGTNLERRAYEINGNDGAILRTVDLPINPYGALAGKLLGLVWFVNAGWQAAANNPPGIVAVEFANGTVHPRQEVQSTIGCTGTYGITIDGQGRVWTGGYPCEATFRYEGTADEGSWMSVDLGGWGATRGLVAADDSKVWVAHSHLGGASVGNLSCVDADSGAVLSQQSLPTGLDAIGVDLDREGNIWTIARATSNAAKLDPTTGVFQEFPVGVGPYTYSDFTGHSLRLQFPQGIYGDVAEACGEAGATWKTAHWEGEVPEGAVVELRVRTAPTREGLADALWYGPWTESPVDLEAPPGPLPEGSFLEFELTLRSLDNASTPHITGFVVTYSCALQ